MSPYITTKHKFAASSRENMPQETTQVLVWLNGTLLALVAALALGYMLLLNATAADGYMLKRLNERMGALREESERLQREAAQIKSTQTLWEKVSQLGLVDAGQLRYPTPPTAVAKNTEAAHD